MNATIKVLAAAMLMATAALAWATEYSFVVENHTGSKITKIQVSEDGASWGNFNIGSGIAAKSQAKLIWDESTNSSGCEWKVKATYADGSESPATSFDFCEKNLVLEFSE